MTALPVQFVVTGAPRSGTGYAAKALTALGLPCTHEGLFVPRPEVVPSRHPTPGESSWMALPFLESHPDRRFPVVTMLRDPRLVASSLYELARRWSGSDPYYDFALQHGSAHPFDPSDGADVRGWVAEFVVDWMDRCLRVADLVWRVGDSAADPTAVASRISAKAGVVPGDVDVAAFEALGTTVNHRHDYVDDDWLDHEVGTLALAWGFGLHPTRTLT